jgi:hypothetical protein
VRDSLGRHHNDAWKNSSQQGYSDFRSPIVNLSIPGDFEKNQTHALAGSFAQKRNKKTTGTESDELKTAEPMPIDRVDAARGALLISIQFEIPTPLRTLLLLFFFIISQTRSASIDRFIRSSVSSSVS